MKVVFISPAGAMHRFNGSFKLPIHYAPLTLTTLASLLPDDVKVEIYDETIEKIPLNIDADLIGITVITGTAPRAYKYANYFRKKGIKVILGGPHPTLIPEEAIKHADSVIVGYAEGIFNRVIDDFKENKLKKIYKMNDGFSLKGKPLPRRDLLKKNKYVTINSVEAIRGCIHKCNFCVVPTFLNYRIYKRPVREVIEEIEKLKGKEIIFIDVNLITDLNYARKLFIELIPLKKWWFGLVTVNILKNEDLFKLMVKSGCKGLLIGFESIVPQSVRNINKVFNRIDEYKLLVKKLHDNGIGINGTFVFGTDNEDKSVFEKTVDAVIKLKIDLPRFAILTPFPRTPLYYELESQNRIIERNWALYDAEHCVFKPLKMKPEELEEGLVWVWKETYSFMNIFKRITNSRTLFILSLLTNIGYKIFANRLEVYTKEKMIDNSDIPEI